MTEPTAGPSGLSPWWRHATILVMIGGFSVLTPVTVLTYTNAPPIPARVVDAAGGTLLDRQTILRGQEAFLKYGLMEHGSLWGHGAYLGPDYSAEYLHRLAEICNEGHARERAGRPLGELPPEEVEVAMSRTRQALKQNRYDPATDTLVFTPCEVASLDTQGREWNEYFRGPNPAPGLPSPLELDFYIRLPESIPTSRLAVLEKANPFKMMANFPFRLMLASMNLRSAIYRALVVNPGTWLPLDDERVYARNLDARWHTSIDRGRGRP